jgi:hypothetical protein
VAQFFFANEGSKFKNERIKEMDCPTVIDKIFDDTGPN